MKARRTIIILIPLLAIGLFVALNTGRLTGIAPMLAIPVVITKNGAAVSPESLISFKYAFNDKIDHEFKLTIPDALENAHWREQYFLVQAPFTIRPGNLFSKNTISPEYHSLFLKINFKDGTTFSVSIPVISDTRLNSPMYLDVSN